MLLIMDYLSIYEYITKKRVVYKSITINTTLVPCNTIKYKHLQTASHLPIHMDIHSSVDINIIEIVLFLSFMKICCLVQCYMHIIFVNNISGFLGTVMLQKMLHRYTEKKNIWIIKRLMMIKKIEVWLIVVK